MIIGFTGTREGLDPLQEVSLRSILLGFRIGCSGKIEFHHGCCIGADADASYIAHNYDYYVIGHPPLDESKVAFLSIYCSDQRAAKGYLERNHDIVDECDHLIACPKEHQEQLRSGTWATIRYAKKKKKPMTIVYPDGNSETFS